jgi:uncharacterized protein (TIGR02996 family)
MSDEAAMEELLRAILENPSDSSRREAYADALNRFGKPGADFARTDPELERIHPVAWLEKIGGRVEEHKEFREEAEEYRSMAAARRQRRELSTQADPRVEAFLSTLAAPFRPFFFFSNSGPAREFTPADLPFRETIGTRGALVTFESDFRRGEALDEGLMEDLRLLRGLELKECFYGAADCPTHPFVAELKKGTESLTGKSVLEALRARDFRSSYIRRLDATHIDYPGYHASLGEGVDNDEIHNDFSKQHIFPAGEGEDEKGEEVDPSSGPHGELKRAVVDGQVWYVLLHVKPKRHEEQLLSSHVILLAVGRSRRGPRLLGVVTHQVCHNLCD